MVNCKNCGKTFKFQSILAKHSCKYLGDRKQRWIKRIEQDIRQQKERIDNYHTKIKKAEQEIKILQSKISNLESWTDLNL